MSCFRCSSVRLEITVSDYNNFAPVFTSLTPTATIPEVRL